VGKEIQTEKEIASRNMEIFKKITRGNDKIV
jgi:hypothetical protein